MFNLLKKSTLWLCLLLISTLAMPAWSLPKSMIMTLQVSSHQGSRPVTANAKVWYADSKVRAEINSNMAPQNTGTVRISNKATIVIDLNTKVGYLIDDGSRTAIRVDSSQLPNNGPGGSLTNPATITDPAKIRAEIQRQGGKIVGKANLLGHPCTIWQMTSTQKVPNAQGQPVAQAVTSKVWLADDLSVPLKVDVTSASGNLVSLNVTSVQANVPVSGGIFGVPAGYAVRNLADMYKAPR